MREHDIEVHGVSDWEAIYVDGESVYQDHSGVLAYWLERHAEFPMTIKSLVTQYHEGDRVDDYAQNSGRLPATLTELRSLEG